MMKKLCLTVVLVLLLAAIPAVPAAECNKSYLVQLELSPSGVTEKSTQLVYGSEPFINSSSMGLLGEIVDRNGRVLSSFWLWDPRIQLGEDVVMDKNGTVKSFNGVTTTAARADLIISLPYSPEAAAFRLSDKGNTLLKTVDLTKAHNGLYFNCTTEMYAKATPQSAVTGMNGMLPVIGLLVLVCVAAGAGWYFLKKR